LYLADHATAAILLAVYGTLIVSTCDHFVKIWAIRGTANLHPLLVFVCVFGGIQLMGLLGIFVGPVIGAVLFALMRILKQEMLPYNPPTDGVSKKNNA
jgi:predicted PurR-regulated permease PerM